MSDSDIAQQQLLQPSRQQSASWRSLVNGSSSCGPSATSLQSPSTTTGSQHMVTPIRPGYSASVFPSNVSARSPIINTISLSVGNPQAGGGQIRAPAPHLQPYRPWHSFFLFLFSLPSWERFSHNFWRENIVVLMLMLVFFFPQRFVLIIDLLICIYVINSLACNESWMVGG